jgi:hypothetical protein
MEAATTMRPKGDSVYYCKNRWYKYKTSNRVIALAVEEQEDPGPASNLATVSNYIAQTRERKLF